MSVHHGVWPTMTRFASVLALAATAVVGLPAGPALAFPRCTEPFNSVDPHSVSFFPVDTEELYGVATVPGQPHDGWVVGRETDAYAESPHDETFIAKWDGGTNKYDWRSSDSPERSTTLYAVAASGPSNAWAVGYRMHWIGGFFTYANPHTLAEHWDGSQWQTVPTPDVDVGEFADPFDWLSAVAVAGTKAWAVGQGAITYPNSGGLIEAWDGTSWSITGPSLIGDSLYGVTALAGDDVWAVGSSGKPLTVHWDGTSWTVQELTGPGFTGGGLNSVSASAWDDIWAAGWDQTGATMVLHYDGGGWSRISTPSIGSVSSISAHAPYDVWMVSGSTIAHFDGTAWKLIGAPDLLGGIPASLKGIVARSATDVRVAGYHGGGDDRDFGHTYLAGMLCATQLVATGISPSITQAVQGGSAYFVVPPRAPHFETLADASPLGLFDSDRIEPGHSFSYDYPGAGTFPIRDDASGGTAEVVVPVIVSKRKTVNQVTVRWSSAVSETNLVFDAQVRTPSSTVWMRVVRGTTTSNTPYTLASGPGKYLFRARVRIQGTNVASGWSPVAAIEGG